MTQPNSPVIVGQAKGRGMRSLLLSSFSLPFSVKTEFVLELICCPSPPLCEPQRVAAASSLSSPWQIMPRSVSHCLKIGFHFWKLISFTFLCRGRQTQLTAFQRLDEASVSLGPGSGRVFQSGLVFTEGFRIVCLWIQVLNNYVPGNLCNWDSKTNNYVCVNLRLICFCTNIWKCPILNFITS